MSTIDLDRLIVRRTYFVPIKASEVKNAILTELASTEKEINGISSWNITEEHKYSAEYSYSYQYCYVEKELAGVVEKQDKFKQLVMEKALEFEKGYPHILYEVCETLRDNLPIRIYASIIKRHENGCTCEVECLPILYDKIGMELMKLEDVTDFNVQDAIVTCGRFVRHIFESGFSSTLIKEEKKEVLKPSMMFLVNDVRTRQITEKITAMVDEATNEILIFAWMGTFLLRKLRELKEKGVEIRVITGNVKGLRQDVMRREKERAMKELISIIGKDHISIKPEFHGRAIIVDNKALIGSMDLDSYSLTGTRIEFATYTEDPETVRNLRNYFNRIFSPWKE